MKLTFCIASRMSGFKDVLQSMVTFVYYYWPVVDVSSCLIIVDDYDAQLFKPVHTVTSRFTILNIFRPLVLITSTYIVFP